MYSTFFLMKTKTNDDLEIEIELDMFACMNLPVSGYTGNLIEEMNPEYLKELNGFMAHAKIRMSMADPDLKLYKITSKSSIERDELEEYLNDLLHFNKKGFIKILKEAEVLKGKKSIQEEDYQKFINSAIHGDIDYITGNIDNYISNQDILFEALHNASVSGHMDIVDRISQDFEFDEISEKNKQLLISSSVASKKVTTTKYLIKEYYWNDLDNKGLLDKAVDNDDYDMAKLLINSGCQDAFDDEELIFKLQDSENNELIALIVGSYGKNGFTEEQKSILDRYIGSQKMAIIKKTLLKPEVKSESCNFEDNLGL